MRSLAPIAVILTALFLIIPLPAGAVTLEHYFFGFSDRDRGVYLTGVLDLFAADSSRDPEYRHCVSELGAAGMHEALSKIVREDPRLLSFDATLWILYEASRRCNTSGEAGPVPDPRSMVRPVEPSSAPAGVPDLAAVPPQEPAASGLDIESLRLLVRDWRYAAAGFLVIFLAGTLAGYAALRLRRRSGRRKHAGSEPRNRVRSGGTGVSGEQNG